MRMPTGQRLSLGTLLLLAMGIAPALQYGYGALAPFLIEDLGITRAEVGLLTSALFTTSAIGAPLFGGIVDRLGARAGLLMLFVTGAASAVLFTVAAGYPMLVVSAVAAGAPMALGNPATNLLVRQRVPPGERGLLMGVKQSGVQVAAALAGATLPALAVVWGWRAAGPVVAVFAMAGTALTARVTRSAGSPARPDHAGHRTATVPPAVRWVAGYAACMGAAQAVLPAYLTLFGFERAGMSPQMAGLALTVMGAVAALSRVVWARHAERETSLARPLGRLSIAAALAVVCIAAAPWAGTVWLFVGAVAFGASAPVWNVFAMLAVVRAVDEGAVGRATALIYTGFSLGFIAGTPLFGLVVDVTGTYLPSWLGTAACCVLGLAVSQGLRAREHRPGFSFAASADGPAGTALEHDDDR